MSMGAPAMTCEWCGCNYQPRRERRVLRWCSRKCGYDAANAKRRDERLARAALRQCLECGATLEGRNLDTKWCSTPCSLKTSNRKAVQRRAKLKKAYGLTEAAYLALLDDQDGRCAICKSDDAKHHRGTWSVDHDHITGVVRGLLCSKCNTGIGQLQDDPDILRAAIAYLESARLMVSA